MFRCGVNGVPLASPSMMRRARRSDDRVRFRPAGNDVPAGASATPFQTSVSVLTLATSPAAPSPYMAGVLNTSCCRLDFPVVGFSVLRFTEPKKLTEFFIEKMTRSNAGAPISRSPINRRLSRVCDSRNPGGSTPRAAASASAASLPTFRLFAASTRLRVP